MIEYYPYFNKGEHWDNQLNRHTIFIDCHDAIIKERDDYIIGISYSWAYGIVPCVVCLNYIKHGAFSWKDGLDGEREYIGTAIKIMIFNSNEWIEEWYLDSQISSNSIIATDQMNQYLEAYNKQRELKKIKYNK